MGIIHLIALAFLLICSAFFSASETAYFSLGRDTRRRLRDTPGRFNHLILALLADPRELLVTVLFGNMLVNTAFYSISAVAVLQAHPHWQSAVIAVSTFLALILFGEILPKNFSVVRAETVARTSALPLYGLQIALLPIRKLLAAVIHILTYRPSKHEEAASRYVTAEELKMLVDLSAQKGLIEPGERDMIQEVIELSTVRIREIMVPRVDVLTFDLRSGSDAFREFARRTRQADIVVYEHMPDNVVGVVNVRTALLSSSTDLRSVLQPPLFVPELAPVEQVLRLFRSRKEHFAVAVDEYGGFAGIVTLEHIVEEIVGNIPDELEPPEAEPVQDLGRGRYRLAGDLSIRDWADLFDVRMDIPKFDTLAGLVIFLLGRLPKEGDTVRYGNLKFTVERMHRRRILSILVQADPSRVQPVAQDQGVAS